MASFTGLVNEVAIRKMTRIGIQKCLVLEVDRDRHNGQQTINIFFLFFAIHWFNFVFDSNRFQKITNDFL